MVNGQSEGLRFLLDTLEEYEIRATFFVEALQVAYFGDEPMQEIAREIMAAGHDVQLHLHPVWVFFDGPDWRRRLATCKPRDEMHRRETAELVQWMQAGICAFERWGVPAPKALRTGNMMVDRNVYGAMCGVGLQVSSSIAVSRFRPTDTALQLNHGVHWIDGIVELPVFSYNGVSCGPWARRKSWTVMGTSARETRFLLMRAHTEGIEAVVLLTHCHEFVSGSMRGALSRSRVNQERFRDLCAFLRSTRDCFETACVGDVTQFAGVTSPIRTDAISVPNLIAARTLVQNGLRDSRLI
jgi:hypothetical protein